VGEEKVGVEEMQKEEAEQGAEVKEEAEEVGVEEGEAQSWKITTIALMSLSIKLKKWEKSMQTLKASIKSKNSTRRNPKFLLANKMMN
jgi:hypothetical protein